MNQSIYNILLLFLIIFCLITPILFYSAPSFVRMDKGTDNEKVSTLYTSLFSILFTSIIVGLGYFGYTKYTGSENGFKISFKKSKSKSTSKSNSTPTNISYGNEKSGHSVEERFYNL